MIAHDKTVRTLPVIFGMELLETVRVGWWGPELKKTGLCPLRRQEAEGGEVCGPRSSGPQ